MYFDIAIYKAFRTLYAANGKNADDFFSVNENLWSELCNSEMLLSAMNMQAAAENLLPGDEEAILPELSQEYIAGEYPALMQSLLSVLQNVGKRLSAKVDTKEKK